MNDDGINIDGLYTGLKAFADAVSTLRKTVAQVLPSLIEIGKIFGEFALWAEAVDKMANAQIVFTDDFTLELAHKFCEEPDIVQAVDRYYYEGGHISPLIETLKQHDGMEMYQRFYEEIIAAFQQEHYQLACTGLFSLADGILADASDMQGCVNYEKRIKKFEERISNNEELTGLDRKFWCVYTGLNAVTGTMFNGKPFTEKEEDLLNRNWLQHGRTHRTYTRMDFLKALLLVDGILFFAEQGNAKSQIEEDKA